MDKARLTWEKLTIKCNEMEAVVNAHALLHILTMTQITTP